MTTPSQQKGRPIGFALDDSTAPDSFYRIQSLVIRPEELTRIDPTRNAVLQTAGGAFADVWGAGLPTISIAGHTGWRGSPTKDGAQLFAELRDLVMTQYLRRRDAAVQAGRDPGAVKLIFVDVLDDFAFQVVPTAFVLRRSKSRPLLCQYQINLQVVSEDIDEAKKVFRFVYEDGRDAGIESLADSMGQMDRLVQKMGWLGENFPDFTKALIRAVGKTRLILDDVLQTKREIDATIRPLFRVADLATQAVRNVAWSVAALTGLPMGVKAQLQHLASAMHNCYCVLRNVFKVREALPDYSALYGASTCSSTAGGAPLSPLRNVNAFELLAPVQAASYVTSEGLTALMSAAQSDPVLRPMSIADATYCMERFNA